MLAPRSDPWPGDEQPVFRLRSHEIATGADDVSTLTAQILVEGWRAAGLNVHAGRVTYPAVASELGYKLLPVEEAIAE